MAEIFEDRDYELSGISKFNRYIGDLASTQFCKFVTFKVYGYMLARYAMLNNMDRPCFTWVKLVKMRFLSKLFVFKPERWSEMNTIFEINAKS